ncbi:hypothetical protein HF086_002425 [Spodoptera exigua]|uniref:Protein kinase domain-containing protein n=1 Tax=Spodoptera exigua TaxID=7107 RepID=A0A922MG68_SPOEX|nr:hypothetical protein HF086_002425 [Spodoptera exigua]
MYYKTFERYIALCLLKHITLTLYVSGKPTGGENSKIFTDFQLKDLALDVCTQLELFLNVIKHSIIEPWSEFEEIAVTPQVNYTLWSTELKEGSPIMWRRGETFPRHDVVQVNKTYEIKKDFHPNEDPSVLDGRFTWNTNGDADVCFDVVNSCEKSHLVHKKVWPNNSKEPYVVFDKLPVEDDCIIHVIGLYGTTKLTYRTPSCYQDNCVPPAIEDLFDSWEVHVSWAKPDLLPDSYRVTLIIDGEETQILTLPGDATETVFRNVTSNKKWGFFNVEIKSKLGNKTATTSRAAQFLDTAEDAARDEDQAGGAGVAAVGAGCAAAAALALLCRCRRRRDHLPVPSYKPQDDKPLKEGDTDVLEVWSETEDRWEVRADKLVLHEVIGEGAFGVVRRATLAPHSLLVAVKMLKDFPSLEEIRSFRSEMELMKSVGVHPHLVSLVGCCTGRRPLIIAEYCSRGDLLSYLRYEDRSSILDGDYP